MKTKAIKGTALLATVIVISSVILVSGVAMLSWTQKGYKYAVRKTDDSKMFYIADSGLKYAMAQILDLQANQPLIPKIISNNFMKIAEDFFPSDEFKISKYTITETLTNNIFGLEGIDDEFALVTAYDVRCRVEKVTDQPGMPSVPMNNMMSSANDEEPESFSEVSGIMGRFSVSVLDYGVYYQDSELEIYPDWTEITIEGKVHSNNGLHLGPLRSLRFLDYITCAEDIMHGASPGKGLGWDDRDGSIAIETEEGEYENLRTNVNASGEAEYLDGDDPNWKNQSENKFKDKVNSKDHGVADIHPDFGGVIADCTVLIDPDPRTNDLITIARLRYENLAGLVLTPDGRLFEQSGVITNAEYTTRTYIDHATNLNWIVTTNQFFNRRNLGDWTNDISLGMVNPVDIDMEMFNSWLALQPTAMTFKHHLSDRAGIFYIECSNVIGAAVRINNAEELYDLPKGLTLSTVNPIYMCGDFNIKIGGNDKTNHAALIISDAINVLSASWDDRANQPWPIEILDPDSGDNPDYYAQDPCDTTWNCSVLSGAPLPEVDEYQATGGVQNFIRFLEYWRSHSFDMTGTTACLWKSRQQNRPHNPNRNNGKNEIVPRPDRFPSYRSFNHVETDSPPGLTKFYTYKAISWKKVR